MTKRQKCDIITFVIILKKPIKGYKRKEEDRMEKTALFKVSSTSNAKSVAGSISHTLKGDGDTAPKDVVLQAIGASAINQTCKAIAISRGHLAVAGYDVVTRIGFDVVKIDGEERTILKFFVSLR